MKNIDLDKSLLKRLEQMRVVSRGVFGGNPTGERRSIYRGVGIEFADHRPYSPGDDFRHIDWNVLARTNEIVVKLFDRQESVPLYLLVDCSRSMHVGTPSKLDRAREIAAGLAYVGIVGGDVVRLAFFNDTIVEQSGQMTQRREVPGMAEFLGKTPCGGTTSFRRAISYFSRRAAKRGIVFMLSDFFDPEGIQEGLQSLAYRKFHACGIHMASAEEIEPQATGEFTLVDSESGQEREVRVRKSTLQQYRRAFEEHRRGIEKLLRFYGGGYALVRAEDPLDDILTKVFRNAGILQ